MVSTAEITVSNQETSNKAGRPLALIDLDGTLYPGLLMEQVIEAQSKTSLIRSVLLPRILQEIHKYKNGHKGQSANVTALNALWAIGCKGALYKDLANHAQELVDRIRGDFFPYTREMFQLLKERNYSTYLITGEPQFVAEAVVNQFGGTNFRASMWKTSEVNDKEIITGQIDKPMTSQQKEEKAELLFAWAVKHDRTRSIAVIDSVNDIGLANAVPFSIVCQDASRGLIDYLSRSGRTYVIASSEHMIKFIDKLTR